MRGQATGTAAARRRTPAVVPVSAAELQEARSRWLVQMDADGLERATGSEPECAICLGDMDATEPLVCLPCTGEVPFDGNGGERPAEPPPSSGAKAHLFHAECLSRWLLASATCPTCRRAVRPMLAKARKARGARH